MEFDKNRLMNNINTLIKNKGLKVGAVETEVGISTGYLSRMSKSENDTMPGIDLVWKLAEKLEVSVDALVSGDFDKSNDNLFFIMDFLNSLIEDTNMHEFEWELFEKYEDLAEKYGFGSMPMATKTLKENLQEHYSHMEYISLYDKKTSMKMVGPNYCTFVPAMGPVLLYKLARLTSEKHIVNEYELYVIEDRGADDENFMLICSTLENDGAIGPSLLDLYNCINKHIKDFKITEETRNLIIRYMNRRSQEDLPFN